MMFQKIFQFKFTISQKWEVLYAGIGSIGISNISGPNYSIENQDALNEQARKLAIDDAKTKAELLAKDSVLASVKL